VACRFRVSGRTTWFGKFRNLSSPRALFTRIERRGSEGTDAELTSERGEQFKPGVSERKRSTDWRGGLERERRKAGRVGRVIRLDWMGCMSKKKRIVIFARLWAPHAHRVLPRPQGVEHVVEVTAD
jgi:hypothetical protein